MTNEMHLQDVPRPETVRATDRPNFRTLSDVFCQTACLLSESANGLERFTKRTPLDERELLVVQTLIEARRRAASHLESYDRDERDVTKTWVQYARLFNLDTNLKELDSAQTEDEVIQVIRRLDDELSSSLSKLARSYSPPLEACEKAAALVNHVRRASSAIMNTSVDV